MTEALVQALFDGRHPALAAEVLAWARSSRRARAFFEAHRTKIRAKLAVANDAPTLADVRAELEAAVLLLREASITLAYEPLAAAKTRGPDFALTVRMHTLVYVEVRRLRPAPDTSPDAQRAKLMGVLADKVPQLQPGALNVLWLAAEHPAPVAEALAALPTQDDAFANRHGHADRRAFLRLAARLSAVLVCTPTALTPSAYAQARHPLPPHLARALVRLRKD